MKSPRRPAIQELMDDLVSDLSGLDGLIAELNEKIAPVVGPNFSDTSDAMTAPREEESAMSEYLRARRDHVRNLSERISNLIARIEL